jgi:uncharacterized metal-binding protein
VEQVVPRAPLPFAGLNITLDQQRDINVPAADASIREANFNVDTNMTLRDLDVNRQTSADVQRVRIQQAPDLQTSNVDLNI